MVTKCRTILSAAIVTFFTLFNSSAHAITLIRDADIEYALSELARPLITAAGLSPSRIKVLVIKDTAMNAFVVDHKHVFINSGLILRLKKSSELQAVIAHELAHIARGHIVTRSLNANQMRNTASLGIVLAAVAAASGNPEAATGFGLGVAGSAQGIFLGHTRSEEASADASAVRYLARAQIDPRATLDVLALFEGQDVLSNSRRDAYTRSHPLTSDRIRAVRAASNGAQEFPLDETANYWFVRAQAKLSAFLVAPSATLRKYKSSDRSSIAEMSRAIAYHRQPKPDKALSAINRAIALRTTDPFLYDLKGQILLESRKFSQAVTAYNKANSLRPNHPQILAGLGRAHLASKKPGSTKKALNALEASYARDPRDARMLRDLAVAYSQSGQNARASLATAERYAMLGRVSDAILHAERAAGALPEGSTSWRKARDIIHAAKLAKQ